MPNATWQTWSRAAARALPGLIALVAAGCASKGTAPSTAPVPPPAPAVIALLPDPETKVTGRIHVSNEFGAVDMSAPNTSVRMAPNAPPGPVTRLTDDEVTRLFGEAMAALPPPPRHFTLQFKFESDTLTDASAALVPVILDAVKALPVPEVMIVGHTDTMGDRKSNVALGLKRASAVRGILMQAGLSPALVEVTSHGEGDLLVKTRDDTAEPRNRRVEITVR
jgi:outer membrane protein OmpA-like peptidoglycan-associated protein